MQSAFVRNNFVTAIKNRDFTFKCEVTSACVVLKKSRGYFFVSHFIVVYDFVAIAQAVAAF